MLAIILHKPGRKIKPIINGLTKENIQTVGKLFVQDRPILAKEIFEAHILVLHVDSPDTDILSLIPHIRRKKYTLPIVVYDEHEDAETKRLAKNLSADYYFSRPLHYRTIALRIKHLIYQKETLERNRWVRAFDIALDLEHRTATRRKQDIDLRNKEFALLELFMANRGRVLPRNSIMEFVWDRNGDFASNTVETHIYRLRQKIDGPFEEKLIHTVPCVGYVFEKRDKRK